LNYLISSNLEKYLTMSIKKQLLKSKPECKVTFRITKDLANGAEEARVVGDFNNWDVKSIPMKKLKSGEFTSTLSLPAESEFQFRYLLSGDIWLNDPESDAFVTNEFGEKNSLLLTK